MEPDRPGFWIRAKASVLDDVIFFPLSYAVQLKAMGVSGHVPIAMTLAIYIMPALITVPFWRYAGATPGKLLCSLRVVDAKSGETPRFTQLLNRFFGYFPSFFCLGLGFLWVAWDPEKRAWHDRLSGTRIVRERQPTLRRASVAMLVVSLVAVAGMGGRFAFAIAGGAFQRFVATNRLAETTGRLEGKSNTDVACLGLASRQAIGASTLEGHIDALSFLTGCFETSERTAAACENVPSPSDYKRSIPWTTMTCKQAGRTDPFCPQMLTALQWHCYPGKDKAATIQMGESTYIN